MNNLTKVSISNPDAVPDFIEFDVSTEAVSDVLDWYCGHYSSDAYEVQINGEVVEQDASGRPLLGN